MRKHKNKIIAGIIIAIVLVLVYWWGGDAPGLRGHNPQPSESTDISETSAPAVSASAEIPDTAETALPEALAAAGDIPVKETDEPASQENRPQNEDNTPMTAAEKTDLAERIAGNTSSNAPAGDIEYSENSGMEINESTGKDSYQTAPVPEGMPVPVEPQENIISDKELTCTMSVRCDTVLENIAWLAPEKAELVPKDGMIFAEQTVTFYEGESVFNLLLREMKRNKIHLEFTNTPIYNSAYIEGIGNLYEFDCGELSGWMYKVNGWFPNYGCSRYQLKAGDKVEWVYTCDLGIDVGGHYGARNGM